MKNPIKAMETLNDLRKALIRRVSELGYEIESIALSWSAIKALGAAREDQAARLLCRLRQHLDDLSEFSANVSQEITQMHADPFERQSQCSVLECANCDYETGDADDLVSLDKCSDLSERLTEGDTVPEGECPRCGAFVYKS